MKALNAYQFQILNSEIQMEYILSTPACIIARMPASEENKLGGTHLEGSLSIIVSTELNLNLNLRYLNIFNFKP